MLNTDDIAKARDFAIKHHGDQKYGDKPYVYHLDEVASIVDKFTVEGFDGPYAMVTAYLHDIVEDTKVSIDDVYHRFGPFVANAVGLVTDEPGKNRKFRKRATYMKLRDARVSRPWAYTALLVKLADRVANVRSCVSSKNHSLLKMYRHEHEAFRLAVYRDVPRWQPLMDELDQLLD